MLTALLIASLSGIQAKQIAAPPTDILNGTVVLPEPGEIVTRSTSALLPVELTDGSATLSVPVESMPQLMAALIVAEPTAWTMRLEDPAATGSTSGLARSGSLDWMGVAQPAIVADIAAPVAGNWAVNITGPRNGRGYLLLSGAEATTLESSHLTYDLVRGNDVGLEVKVPDARIDHATARIETPGGATFEQPLAGGAFAQRLVFTAEEVGDYIVHVLVHGNREGEPFVRSTQQIISIAERSLLLDGTVTSTLADGVYELQLAATVDVAIERVLVAAEVWNNDEPVCWIGGMAGPFATGAAQLPLTLDARWLAGRDGPFELRAVRVQDTTNSVPIDRLPTVSLDDVTALNATPAEVVPEMLTGRPGARVLGSELPPATGSPLMEIGAHNLLLVHGYCIDNLPFPPAHFTGAVEIFVDIGQNRTHDQFALLIGANGAIGKSFGVVGHSQGGQASLHLYTYYYSGLDWAQGNRLIQSVGSPYQGTALAGNAAVLGQLFGFGCGVNYDQTYEGAAIWLAGIPTWARARVYYYTTSFSSGQFWCNFVTGTLLTNPEDGVIEVAAGQLPGANNMGNTTGWCHTPAMTEPPQATDLSRNTIMNQEAAR